MDLEMDFALEKENPEVPAENLTSIMQFDVTWLKSIT
jgi:hypothetical protein